MRHNLWLTDTHGPDLSTNAARAYCRLHIVGSINLFIMTIWKFELKKERTQLVKMPEKSEIMDIQMQNGKPVMWALVHPHTPEIEVKINMYGTGWITHQSTIKDEYLATCQDGDFVWHFFMNYEV